MITDYITAGELSFCRTYFGKTQSVALVLAVCVVIAFFTHQTNDIGLLSNILFSLSYGLPISMLETFFQTRRQKLAAWIINTASVLLGFVFGTTCIYTYLVVFYDIPVGYFGADFLWSFGSSFIICIVAFYFFWSRYRNQTLQLALRDQQLKAVELEALRAQAENRLLQAQMEPHFLFNTLANIQTLIDVDAGAAKNMVHHLSQMLRATLRYTTEDQCTLAQELVLVHAYLNIQKVRIGDRLNLIEKIESGLDKALIIPMLLQPLVENAIKHGVEKNTRTTTLILSIGCENHQLVISVFDDAKVKSSTVGHGLSLANINKRLQNRYAKRAYCRAEAEANGWRTSITLPYEEGA